MAQLAFSTPVCSPHIMKRLQHQTPPTVVDPSLNFAENNKKELNTRDVHKTRLGLELLFY